MWHVLCAHVNYVHQDFTMFIEVHRACADCIHVRDAQQHESDHVHGGLLTEGGFVILAVSR